ncbi:MAG: enhanced serine sensitivity protein SseB C-terminal domain-containing protein [Hylemonella sp.]|uniref:enhanced serine sensitivity protein SseB C-terminal domain-containing protein n=1 Tax=Hylemonella sp. TaxID=2066020 RepID=UPI003918E0B7
MADHEKLERALELAASDPASRPEFYRTLMESEVFVIGSSGAVTGQRSLIPAGAKVEIVHWEKQDGTPVIPFFTSLEALRRSLKEETGFMALSARGFFEMVKGKTLVLNPASPYGKEFFPNEIESLLSTGVNHAPVSRTVETATQVLLGQPSAYPTQMVSSLKALLAKHANVRAAHLCLMQEPTSQVPSLVVGFEGEGDISRAMADAGAVAADTAPRGTPVDFIRVIPGEPGLSEYFLSTGTPFYRRTFGATLKRLFGGRKA